MKNRIRSRAAAFAVVSSLSLAAGACSDAPHEDDNGWEWDGPVGSVGLALQLANGVVLDTIQYEISGPGFTRTGSLSVPGSGSVFNATIAEIPTGNGLVIKLRSIAAGDAGIACAGQATFDVTANATTPVEVVLSCDGLDIGGSASVNGSFNICPSVTSSSLSPSVQAVGSTIAVTLTARDVDNAPQPLSYSWTTNTGTLSNATTSAPSLFCTQEGPVALTYVIRDGACVKTGTLNASCGRTLPDAGSADGGVPSDGGSDAGSDAGQPPIANVVINEADSNGGQPDYIELYNKGPQAIDLSGWQLKDNDDTHVLTLPANSIIQPGGYLTFDTDVPGGYGLGSGDSARLFTPAGVLVDSYSWSAHAVGSYGRCPNGLGGFVDMPNTRNALNTCPSTGDAGALDAGTPDAGSSDFAWPGSDTVSDVDNANTWTSNLSGLAYQAGSPNVLWAVQNGPSMIFKLVASGGLWVNSAGDWAAGKTITYPGSVGAPDSEGIALGLNGAMYVSTERDNNASSVSKLSVLQVFDQAGVTTLPATREWNLTADLPAVGANLGLEAIAFIPDAELTSFKEDSGAAYNPNRYPDHGGGVFAIGVEGGGAICLYALDHGSSAFTKLATIPSGFGGVMDLAYDADTNYLWAWTDDTYGNKAALFEIEQSMVSTSYGKFVKRKVVNKPAGLPATNNEGFTFVPDAQCTGGFRSVFWSDDNNQNQHSLRQGSLTCGKSY